MVGEQMMVAPVIENENSRKIYFPAGEWFDFQTHEKYAGGKEYTLDVPLSRIPVFVKSGSIIALAKSTLHTEDPESRKLTAFIFGKNAKPAVLYEEQEAFDADPVKVELHWNGDLTKGSMERSPSGAVAAAYSVVDWQVIE
jgi:alpha-D-xyloside xylohydrolase